MTTKKKIIISVTAAVLVVAVAIVGVVAATTQTIGLTNRVSFTASSVNARIEIAASKQSYSDEYITKNGDAVAIAVTETDGTANDGIITFSATDTGTVAKNATLANQTAMHKYDVLTYEFYIFGTGDTEITATINETNGEGTNLTVTYAYACGTGDTKASATTTCTGSTAVALATAGGTSTLTGIGNGEVVKITATVKVADKGLNATGTFAWNIGLTTL